MANPLNSKWLGGSLVINPPMYSGNAYYVYSGGGSASASGLDWDNALNTIDAAINKCTANKGDVIYVHPYHAENLSSATSIALDVAGVSIIGLKSGQKMPTLTVTATSGCCAISAAGCSIQNLRFVGGIDATTGCISVTAADVSIINCEYMDSTGQATDVLLANADADRLLIDGFRHIGDANAGTNASIALTGLSDCEIKNSYFYGNFAVGAINIKTTAAVRLWVHDCLIWTENSADIAIVDTITGSTGTIGPNVQIMLQDNAANITTAVTGATFQLFDPVYVCNLAGEKGMLISWTASTNA